MSELRYWMNFRAFLVQRSQISLLGILILALLPCGWREGEALPIHEAFLPPEAGQLPLQAIGKEPPKKIEETPPSCSVKETEWIEGYWSYDLEGDRFVWVSGTWRHSPEGRKWVSGYWHQLPQGWVWIQGYWEPLDGSLMRSEVAPPDAFEEDPREPPSSREFWMAGYWKYNQETRTFDWLAGQWVELSPDRVYQPPQYLWRPEGYLFIPSYYDWPIEKRGCIYSHLAKEEGEELKEIEADEAVRQLFVFYPYYRCFYQHHYYYHQSWWNNWWGTPPWWRWWSWWGISWWHQWGLFWWWSHPGYPAPHWVSLQEAEAIWPAPQPLLTLFKGVPAPLNVTPRGVVSPRRLRRAILALEGGRKGNALPVLPADRKVRQRLQEIVLPRGPGPRRPIEPSGKKPRDGRVQELPPPRISPLRGENEPATRWEGQNRGPRQLPPNAPPGGGAPPSDRRGPPGGEHLRRGPEERAPTPPPSLPPPQQRETEGPTREQPPSPPPQGGGMPPPTLPQQGAPPQTSPPPSQGARPQRRGQQGTLPPQQGPRRQISPPPSSSGRVGPSANQRSRPRQSTSSQGRGRSTPPRGRGRQNVR